LVLISKHKFHFDFLLFVCYYSQLSSKSSKKLSARKKSSPDTAESEGMSGKESNKEEDMEEEAESGQEEESEEEDVTEAESMEEEEELHDGYAIKQGQSST
jgi:hypothetical protein